MAMLRVMVPPVPASSWAERPEVQAYRQQVRRRLLSEELERRAAARASPVVAARPGPAQADYAPVPPSIWGEVKLPTPWRREEPAALSPGDYAPFPEPDWGKFRRVEPAPGPRPEPARDPVRRRAVADELGYAPAPPNPWGI
jgi:hypothetical protein